MLFVELTWTLGPTPVDAHDAVSLSMIQEFLDYIAENPRKNTLQGLARCSRLIGNIYYRIGQDQKLLRTLQTIHDDLYAQLVNLSTEPKTTATTPEDAEEEKK